MLRLIPTVTQVTAVAFCAFIFGPANAIPTSLFSVSPEPDSTSLEWSCGPLEPCTPDLRTQTMGGWGSNCSGDNAGCYLLANFDAAFPDGATIGCDSGESLLFTHAQAVIDFLACGGTQALILETDTNSACTDNVLAGQLLASVLNITFDDTFEDFGDDDVNLRDMVFTDPAYAG